VVEAVVSTSRTAAGRPYSGEALLRLRLYQGHAAHGGRFLTVIAAAAAVPAG
jgi:hypothetical protein